MTSPSSVPSVRMVPLAVALILTIAHAGSAEAQTAPNLGNPWYRIAVFDSDEEHAHAILEPSPFDAMTPLQLAALSGNQRIHYNAPSKCVPSELKSVLQMVAGKFGPVTVNSTFRDPSKNRRVGGRKKSWHLKCAAVDFRVHASTKGLLDYLRRQDGVGGYKRYKAGFYHIDIGPRRTW